MNKMIKRFGLSVSIICVMLICGCTTIFSDSQKEFEIVKDGKPEATIIIAEKPTISAKLAAIELQYHIKEMTGATLPIKNDTEAVKDIRILVGESKATRDLGIKASDFKTTEYMIKFLPDTLVLIGKDWVGPIDKKLGKQAFQGRKTIDYNKAIGESEKGKLNIEIPSFREEQGTCYAVYDFLERYCGVRWYGPKRINIIIPKKGNTLVVSGKDLQRTPSIKHRELGSARWPTENHILSAEPTAEEHDLYLKRVRNGGLRWFANHSALDGDWLKDEKTGEALGFTDQRLVDKLVKAARNFFDGKGLPEFTKKGNCHVFAMGDYFSIVPNDSNLVRVSEEDKKAYARSSADKRGKGHFGQAQDSYYLFQLLNKVAKEVKKTHPDKKIATLAYSGYSYKPKGLELESNIVVAPCLAACGYGKGALANDRKFYSEWAEWAKKNDAELFIWGYFHSPYESGMMKKFNVFPLFVGDRISKDVNKHVDDGLTGIFLCGGPVQPDNYIYMRTAWDADNADFDTMLDEYFSKSFGKASSPMRKFYDRVREINKKEQVSGSNLQNSWGVLGTDERMKEFGSYFAKAKKLAETKEEKARVELWHKAFWNRMLQGKEQYKALQIKENDRLEKVAQWKKAEQNRLLKKIHDKAPHKKIADSFIPHVKVYAHSAGESPYTLVDGKCMKESTKGVLGTKNAKLDAAKADTCWYGIRSKGIWVKIDLQKEYKLDEIRIWNRPKKGMKEVKVEYSLTGRKGDWKLLEKLTLKKENTIQGNGKKARFLKIESLDEDLKDPGLGQIRIYGKK